MHVTQSELPVERDTVQCRDGAWVFIRYRMAQGKILVQSADREVVWKAARLVGNSIWEEHYIDMVLVDCIPPAGVWRHPETTFLVTNGSPRPSPSPVESGIFLADKKYRDPAMNYGEAPKTPLSTGVEPPVRGWNRVKRVLNISPVLFKKAR